MDAAGRGGDAPVRSKPHQAQRQQKKRGRPGFGAQEEVGLTADQAQHVKIVRVETKSLASAEDLSRVQLSKTGKATQLLLSEDRLSVTGHRGFRTVRASHGAHVGTWYCEVTVTHLGKSGHVRLGWCTRKAELQAPVGFDEHGFSYRDLEGSKVHKGLREPYGEAYSEGDVIGLVLHMPEGGRTLETIDRNVVRFKGAYHYQEEQEPKPQPLVGSMLVFTRNGVSQGPAFKDIPEGTYYPGASLFTLPEQQEGATVTFNFGPDFKYPPPTVEGLPAATPMCNKATLDAQAAATAGATAEGEVPPGTGMAVDADGATGQS